MIEEQELTPEQIGMRYAIGKDGKGYKYLGVDAEGCTLFTHEPEVVDCGQYLCYESFEGDCYSPFQYSSPRLGTTPYLKKIR